MTPRRIATLGTTITDTTQFRFINRSVVDLNHSSPLTPLPPRNRQTISICPKFYSSIRHGTTGNRLTSLFTTILDCHLHYNRPVSTNGGLKEFVALSTPSVHPSIHPFFHATVPPFTLKARTTCCSPTPNDNTLKTLIRLMLYARSIYSRAFYPPKLNQRGVLSSACHATQRREWPATVRRRRRSSRERICLSAFTTTTTFSSVRFAAKLPPTASHSCIHLLEFRCYSFFLITFTPSSFPI